MSTDDPTTPSSPSAPTLAADPTQWEHSIAKAQSAIQSLSAIVGPIPDSITFSETPARHLLHDPSVGHSISSLLRHPSSGVGDDNLCRWLYDTFHSMDPLLQLVVLRFVPALVGVYLSRAVGRRPLAGFEAVLLALYAHETKARGGQPQIVNIPNVASHPSLYHETPRNPGKNRAIDLHLAVLSPVLEPHGTVRSTKRARIVGVALELYYSKLAHMPVCSKAEFCRFCVAWAGQEGCEEETGGPNGGGGETEDTTSDGDECSGENGRRIPMPWELFQPVVRIVGHCLLGSTGSEELRRIAFRAARCLYARAMHDMLPQAILATRSLLRLGRMEERETDLGALEDLRPVEPPPAPTPAAAPTVAT